MRARIDRVNTKHKSKLDSDSCRCALNNIAFSWMSNNFKGQTNRCFQSLGGEQVASPHWTWRIQAMACFIFRGPNVVFSRLRCRLHLDRIASIVITCEHIEFWIEQNVTAMMLHTSSWSEWLTLHNARQNKRRCWAGLISRYKAD